MNEIFYVGYSAAHPSDFLYEYSENHSFYLLVLAYTPAEFLIDGAFVTCPANTAILYPPGQHILYRACGQSYTNDWLRFSSDETFVTQFPRQGVPFPVSDPEYCHNLFQLLTWETYISTDSSALMISNLLRVLFHKLAREHSETVDNTHTTALLRLRKQIYNHPQADWNIHQMADQLHISAGYLQLLYKKRFDISCMDDVIEGRIRMAKDNLIYTRKSIREIAELCGYRNVEHFCRQFKAITGYTPGQYRKSGLL